MPDPASAGPWFAGHPRAQRGDKLNRAVLERSSSKNDDKVRWERLISGYYSLCNGFLLLFFIYFCFVLFGLSD